MEIFALTRTVVKKDHAIICPDGYVNSVVPGWTNCTVTVMINEQMGARFCQNLISLNNDGKLNGTTKATQIFFYIIKGKCTVIIDEQQTDVSAGYFVYVPIEKKYEVRNEEAGTQLLSFHKPYEKFDGNAVPSPIIGDAAKISSSAFLGDEALQLQVLLPDQLSFDMAVNIFTYQPGGHLPFVETHIMEHGLLFLQGQGIYRLNDQWYPVKKGDAIWMASYCPQWFTAMGKEPAVYIYYKDVNRFPVKE